MTESVDLTALRDLTDGDEELEKELFNSFQKISKEFIEALENLTNSDNDEAWKQNSHSFKGAALNLGANILAEKCKESEKISGATEKKKEEILTEINKEYEKVRVFLDKVY